MLTHVDTFSGIGGFSLAAHWAGFETVLHCENHPFCRAVLGKNFPGVPIVEDIRLLTKDTIRGYGIEHVHILTGGFPCQGISAAGKGEGLSDGRSGLWFEMHRAIDEILPDWVVIENSPILRVRGADIVLQGLEESGYTCWPLVVGADDAGAPHERKRTWVVAHSNRFGFSPGAERGGWETRTNIDRRSERASMVDSRSLMVQWEGCDKPGDMVKTDENKGCERRGSILGATAYPSSELGEPDCFNANDGRYGTSEIFGDRSASPELQRSQFVVNADHFRLEEQRSIVPATSQDASVKCAGSELADTAERRIRCGRGCREESSSCCQELANTNDSERSPYDPEGCGDSGDGSLSGRQEISSRPRICSQELGDPESITEWPGLCTHEQGRERRRRSGHTDGEGSTDGGWGAQSRLGRDNDGLPGWLDFAGWPAGRGEEQYPFEPPRVTQEKDWQRAPRLMALGNTVVPQVVYPILQWVYEQIMNGGSA